MQKYIDFNKECKEFSSNFFRSWKLLFLFRNNFLTEKKYIFKTIGSNIYFKFA